MLSVSSFTGADSWLAEPGHSFQKPSSSPRSCLCQRKRFPKLGREEEEVSCRVGIHRMTTTTKKENDLRVAGNSISHIRALKRLRFVMSAKPVLSMGVLICLGEQGELIPVFSCCSLLLQFLSFFIRKWG